MYYCSAYVNVNVYAENCMYVVYKWERVVDIVLVIIVVVVVGEKWGDSFSLTRVHDLFRFHIHMHKERRSSPTESESHLFGWLFHFLVCTFDGVWYVTFGVLQMNGNKSAEAYFNTCNRDISSNGCACGDGMWHAINAFVQRAPSVQTRQKRTPLHPLALMNNFVLSFHLVSVPLESNGNRARFAIYFDIFIFRLFGSFRIHFNHSQNTPIHNRSILLVTSRFVPYTISMNVHVTNVVF